MFRAVADSSEIQRIAWLDEVKNDIRDIVKENA
jgi:hypothetical protein